MPSIRFGPFSPISSFIFFVRVSVSLRTPTTSTATVNTETFATVLIGLVLAGVVWPWPTADWVRSCSFTVAGKLPVPGWFALAAAVISIVSKEILFSLHDRKRKEA